MSASTFGFGPSTYPSILSNTNDFLAAPQLKALSRFVGTRVKSPADAEDIIQDTLLLAFRHIGQFRFEASVGTWLRCIALNVMRGRWRRHESSRTVVTDSDTLDRLQVVDKRKSPYAELEHKENSDRLHGAISKLPPTYRAVVELRDFQGLSLEETAVRLATSKPAIKSRHFRARTMLLKTLSAQ